MTTVEQLLEANLRRVFGNRDAATRRAAIEEVYSPDVAFTDPERTVVGWDALEATAAGLLDRTPPEFAFREVGLRYADATTGALAWEFGPEGSPVARGIDLITVVDERITSLHTILADQP